MTARLSFIVLSLVIVLFYGGMGLAVWQSGMPLPGKITLTAMCVLAWFVSELALSAVLLAGLVNQAHESMDA